MWKKLKTRIYSIFGHLVGKFGFMALRRGIEMATTDFRILYGKTKMLIPSELFYHDIFQRVYIFLHNYTH